MHSLSDEKSYRPPGRASALYDSVIRTAVHLNVNELLISLSLDEILKESSSQKGSSQKSVEL